jgi:hypothetical protein
VLITLNLLLYTFNLQNSIQLIADLSQINISQDIKLYSFDVNNMHNNRDVNVQRITVNAVVIPLQEFEHLSRWYYRMQKGEKCELGIVTCGIMSITNFMNSLTATIWLLNSFRRLSRVRILGQLGQV